VDLVGLFGILLDKIDCLRHFVQFFYLDLSDLSLYLVYLQLKFLFLHFLEFLHQLILLNSQTSNFIVKIVLKFAQISFYSNIFLLKMILIILDIFFI
jgi:hypothetical protein